MSEYDMVPRSGALKLKRVDPTIKKKKKKKAMDMEKRKDPQTKNTMNEDYEETPEDKDIEAAMMAKIRERNPLLHKTKAELRALQMQEKLKEERLLDKASKTHKMKVEEFNQHLDNLTEHFDIPKVSWTK